MIQQAVDSYELPQDKTEIIEIFKKYDFRDRHGHPLHNSVDFLQLVDGYCPGGKESKNGLSGLSGCGPDAHSKGKNNHAYNNIKAGGHLNALQRMIMPLKSAKTASHAVATRLSPNMAMPAPIEAVFTQKVAMYSAIFCLLMIFFYTKKGCWQ